MAGPKHVLYSEVPLVIHKLMILSTLVLGCVCVCPVLPVELVGGAVSSCAVGDGPAAQPQPAHHSWWRGGRSH